ncbi:hypothetical protein C8R46DRAFT_289084 [Mycena filopes]|nr:hypothetical protein C8R46DRAFT_289084 [Mycena filopes]
MRTKAPSADTSRSGELPHGGVPSSLGRRRFPAQCVYSVVVCGCGACEGTCVVRRTCEGLGWNGFERRSVVLRHTTGARLRTDVSSSYLFLPSRPPATPRADFSLPDFALCELEQSRGSPCRLGRECVGVDERYCCLHVYRGLDAFVDAGLDCGRMHSGFSLHPPGVG